jgi:hypothetical protein
VVPGSQLQATLEELQELSQQTFLLALQSQVRQQLGEYIETPPSDLSPSPGVSQLLNLLREVLSVGSIAEGRQQDLTQVKNKGLCDIFYIRETNPMSTLERYEADANCTSHILLILDRTCSFISFVIIFP